MKAAYLTTSELEAISDELLDAYYLVACARLRTWKRRAAQGNYPEATGQWQLWEREQERLYNEMLSRYLSIDGNLLLHFLISGQPFVVYSVGVNNK